MRKNKLTSILLTVLIITLSLSFLTNNVRSASTKTYTFVNDNFANSTNPTLYDDFNVKDYTIPEFTEIYNGTYSFTNDANGSVPVGWNDYSTTGCSVEVIQELDGHHKVLDSYDNGVGAIRPITYVSNESFGTVDYWIRVNDVVNMFAIEFFDNSDYMLRITISGSDWLYWDGSWNDFAFTPVIDTWYHFRIDFECSAGGYEGLAQYDWRVYINGVKYGDYDFDINVAELNQIGFITSGGQTGVHGYIDAISYSWDTDYDINDNIIPYYENKNSVKEVDKYQFSFSDFEVPYSVGSDVFDTWSEIDGAGDDVNIAIKEIDNDERVIKMEQYTPDTDDLGIEKEFNVEYAKHLNVSMNFQFEVIPTSLTEFTMLIYSYDDTLIADVYFKTNQLRSDSPLVVYNSSIQTDTFYDVNVFINYASDSGVISFTTNDTWNYIYPFNLIATGKDGLGKVKIFVDVSGGDCVVLLDNIGVYVNGSSISDNFAYETFYPIKLASGMNLDEHNIFSFTGYGNMSIMISREMYLSGISTITELVPLGLYNGSYTFNAWQSLYIYIPQLWSFFFNYYNTSIQSNFTAYSLNGVKLTDGTNDYYLEYEGANVNKSESYFYATAGNFLRYTLICDDNDTEYIQATFNIIDVASENRSISFVSDLNGGSKGYFAVDYDDASSSIFDIKIFPSTVNVILPQTKIIDKFTILITDNDKDDNDISTGYVHSVQLIYYTDLSISIATLSLVNALVPIIIMLVPTLAFAKKYGKNIIVPMIMIMSIISVATDLIPVWLFFVIILSSGAFLFMKFKGGSE